MSVTSATNPFITIELLDLNPKMFDQIMFIKNAPLESLPSINILLLTMTKNKNEKKSK